MLVPVPSTVTTLMPAEVVLFVPASVRFFALLLTM